MLKRTIHGLMIACSLTVFSQAAIASPAQQETFNHYGKSLIDEDKASKLIQHWSRSVDIDLSSPIVDLGCGYGRLSYALSKMGAKDITAIDVSPANISKAKADWENQPTHGQTQLNFSAADITKTSSIKKILPKGQAGFVFSNQVFQYLPGQAIENTLENAHYSLKNGGTFLMTVQNPVDQVQMSHWYQEQYDVAADHILNATGNPSRAQMNHEVKRFEVLLNETHQQQYEVLPSSYLHYLNKRLPLYPLELKAKTVELGEAPIRHLLFPQNMKSLMQQAGFTDVQFEWNNGSSPENSGFTVYGKKV